MLPLGLGGSQGSPAHPELPNTQNELGALTAKLPLWVVQGRLI